MKIFLILLMSCCIPVCTWAQEKVSAESIKEKYRKRILEVMKKDHVVGVSLIVLDSTTILWQESFGYSDKSSKQSVNENTMFGIGSVTKVFTAAAALKAQEQNLWDIDKPLSTYIPFHPRCGEKNGVTLRSMLYHHSGLPSDIFSGMFNAKSGDYKTILNAINDEPLAAEPGLIRAYSNPAFSLIGYGIETVAGISYQDYVKQNILQPLGMYRTHFDCSSTELSKTYNRQGEEISDACLRDVPAGGMYTTTSDMARWAKALLREDQHILSSKSFHDMFSVQNKNVPLDFDNQYGLSWSLNEKPFVGKYWSHTGTTLYYNSSLIIAKESGLAVCILTNSQNGDNIYSMGSSILRDVAQAKGLVAIVTEKNTLGNKKKIEIPKATLDSCAGNYVQPGLVLPIRRKGNKLATRITGFKVTLTPVEKNAFVPKVWLLGAIPIRLGDTRFYFENISGYDVLTQRSEGSTKEMLGVRLNPKPMQEWETLIGKYENKNPLVGEIELLKSLEIKIINDVLVLAIQMHGSKREMIMALDIESQTQAKVAGLGRYAGTGVEVLKLNNMETTIKAFGIKLTRAK